jgi:hypothetical protein
MAAQELATYLITKRPDHIKEGILAIAKDMRIEQAAPNVPYKGTKKTNDTRNIDICMDPIDTIFLGLLRLFNFEIAFITIAEGKMPIERISSIFSADIYCVPIIESMNWGATMSTTIKGTIKLKPILKLPEDKSVFASADAGITMNEKLEDKLAATIVIIKAT